MKHILKSIIVLSLVSTAACNDAPKADEAQTAEAQQVQEAPTGTDFAVDNQKSTLSWIGTKPVGKHDGIFPISTGTLSVADNNITGGRFDIDMANLKVLDGGEGNEKLQGHLKSGDFFDVTKYPNAKFEITSVAAGVATDPKDLVMKDATHTVTGNLTLKDSTKSVTFPAKVSMNGNSLIADADFNIDRTQWGIVYGNDKSLGDKFIRPEVNIKLHIEANKQ